MKYIIIILVLSSISVKGQNEPSDFLGICKDEYLILLSKISSETQEEFKRQNYLIDSTRVADADLRDFFKTGYSKEYLETIYPFQSLNETYGLLLPTKTNLVNSMGDSYHEALLNRIQSSIDSIKITLNEYKNTAEAQNFVDYLNTANAIYYRLDSIKRFPKVKHTFTYKPIPFAYGKPTKIQTFEIYDWEDTYSKLLRLEGEIQGLKSKIEEVKYLRLKEPIPIIPVIFQFAALLILISNLLVNFNFNSKLSTAVVISVIISMIVSFILLFTSSNTIMNSAINVFVPGVMYLIYYKRNKKSQRITLDNDGITPSS